MDFFRSDVKHFDALISALTRLRFDVNGTECIQLSTHLAWLGNLRVTADAEASGVEAEQEARIAEGLALLAAKEKAASAPAPAVESDPAEARLVEPPLAASPIKRAKLKG